MLPNQSTGHISMQLDENLGKFYIRFPEEAKQFFNWIQKIKNVCVSEKYEL